MDQAAVNNHRLLAESLGRWNIFGPIGKFINEMGDDVGKPIGMINKGVGIAIGIITTVAFLYFMFLIFTAGFSWLTAGGDQKRVESASKQIYNAVIGLIIVVSATSIISLIGKILGINVLNPLGWIIGTW